MELGAEDASVVMISIVEGVTIEGAQLLAGGSPVSKSVHA
jgi:hypothetical protein